MNQDITLRLTTALIGFSIALSCLEYILLFRNRLFSKVWSYAHLENELIQSLPFPKKLTHFLFNDESFKVLVTLQMVLAVTSMSNAHFLVVLTLLMIQILICIRFRGTFNGGSDFMTVVVLTGLCISLADPTLGRAGLIYISVHVIYSYYKAGLVKIKNTEWIKGDALYWFFANSPIHFTQQIAHFLKDRKFIFQFISVLVIFFEMGSLLLIFFPKGILPYMCVAIVFHFSVYITFGLNRFFWVWLAAWPATFFAVSLLI